ncbi:MAG: bifunctional UDP-N-acetylglucosamine diphosphorylase/glucosamine-1-phosphate N-acetyltransferase GlmU [Zetaproteobacteria bacterium]|nr:bifunctional UDP-N-acetylglucosamine diphosphorylase/glucosamine-1-phosphate N-acetyltransferase GlmU [Zetaproteobacteria bacterium]
MPHTMNYPNLQICVLAAGKGKRMRSQLPKVLHQVLGKAMLDHVLHTVEELHPKGIAVVTGHASERVIEHVGPLKNLEWVHQDQQLGTAHAVKQCESVIRDVQDVLIVCGDTPLLRSTTLDQLVKQHRQSNADITVLTAKVSNPKGYGRIVRDEHGGVKSIVEERDTTPEQALLNEVSSGIYCVRFEVLFNILHQIENHNAQSEYYLPDMVPIGLRQGATVSSLLLGDVDEMMGVNDRSQLALAEEGLQQRIIHEWQEQGVTIEQPHTVRIEASVSIGVDSRICAGAQLLGSTHIGDGCVIGAYTVIQNGWIDDEVNILPFSHIDRANVGAKAYIGPFARLRPDAKLDEHVHIGNFVEVKNAVIGRGSKVNHLSYIGDSEVGQDCNIGAGSITCNYDGANKHKTVIGDRVFVGSSTKFIAPVSVGDDATIGADSVVTQTVNAGGLTLSKRGEMQYSPNWKRPVKDL